MVFRHEINITDFRNYVKNVSQNSSNPAKVEVPQSVQKPKDVVKTIAVSSADAQRGLSRIIIIYSNKRSRLTVENVASHVIINLISLSFSSRELTSWVKTWLERNLSTDANRVKKKKDKDIDNHQVAI